MEKAQKYSYFFVVEDAYVRDVHANFGEVQTFGEYAAKKTNLQFL